MNKGLMAIYMLNFINLLIVSNKHGQDSGKHNIWISLIGTALSLLLIWWALGWEFI